MSEAKLVIKMHPRKTMFPKWIHRINWWTDKRECPKWARDKNIRTEKSNGGQGGNRYTVLQVDQNDPVVDKPKSTAEALKRLAHFGHFVSEFSKDQNDPLKPDGFRGNQHSKVVKDQNDLLPNKPKSTAEAEPVHKSG